MKLTSCILALMAVAAAEAGCRRMKLNGDPLVVATFTDTACYNKNYGRRSRNRGACINIKNSKSFIFESALNLRNEHLCRIRLYSDNGCKNQFGTSLGHWMKETVSKPIGSIRVSCRGEPYF
ncbi:hypothetical protein BX616_000540 [Lobosporangium transversale]|uniref:Cyanovirin-N domain-containing protein n=1 Tax=Lobosporangium transversale TaxID=64571 RepID=A0A1Y2GEV8_9FUNG|nr:hypothetical protein BCR41DRAFT_425420 [Lobosporangium transversale]KAF9907075.1 hypothetical protein BX616_000540 [Lobosporangium transversale]ORZ05734.1 hypothetical protein BCR41DRAFT_425420 [Lobosporangium transversale]|eukprot:XP_021877221.1 hypothetical protein BCR41DRAFT_425420 [Lobosporangium transversale]